MKNTIILILFTLWGTASFAQDTAYVSRDKTTALLFQSAVKIIGNVPAELEVSQKEIGLIILKAVKTGFTPFHLNVQQLINQKTYDIAVEYSYGRAGKRMEIGEKKLTMASRPLPEYRDSLVAGSLAMGKRENTVDHKKSGGIKVWICRLSLAGNRIFFRLDVCNHSNLPYDIDFIRFYIRNLQTVTRMATHEQEILPVYTTLKKHCSIEKNREIAGVFTFRRFSLSDGQALELELYERNGSRHLSLQIKQKDLNNLQTIDPVSQQPANTGAAHTL